MWQSCLSVSVLHRFVTKVLASLVYLPSLIAQYCHSAETDTEFSVFLNLSIYLKVLYKCPGLLYFTYVGVHLCSTYYELLTSRQSGMARVNEGSHSFTCHPHVYPQVE